LGGRRALAEGVGNGNGDLMALELSEYNVA
jgi:hypothetical protein